MHRRDLSGNWPDVHEPIWNRDIPIVAEVLSALDGAIRNRLQFLFDVLRPFGGDIRQAKPSSHDPISGQSFPCRWRDFGALELLHGKYDLDWGDLGLRGTN